MKPFLSICIPTFNRATFLEACLKSITDQFSDPEVASLVSVVILDNQSADNTREVGESYSNRFVNVQYVCDSEKRGIAQGIIAAARLATGEYTWVFSDDDLQKPDCLKKVIAALHQQPADVIITNFDSILSSGEVRKKNMLALEGQNTFYACRMDLLKFINTKFYYTIDAYVTFCSNWILKTEVVQNGANTLARYSAKDDVFPFQSIVFYGQDDFTTLIIADRVLFFRSDNASWAKKNPIATFFYSDKLWRHHFGLIVQNNKTWLPPGFTFHVAVKNILRFKDFVILVGVLILRKLGLYSFVKKCIAIFKPTHT